MRTTRRDYPYIFLYFWLRFYPLFFLLQPLMSFNLIKYVTTKIKDICMFYRRQEHRKYSLAQNKFKKKLIKRRSFLSDQGKWVF